MSKISKTTKLKTTESKKITTKTAKLREAKPKKTKSEEIKPEPSNPDAVKLKDVKPVELKVAKSKKTNVEDTSASKVEPETGKTDDIKSSEIKSDAVVKPEPTKPEMITPEKPEKSMSGTARFKSTGPKSAKHEKKQEKMAKVKIKKGVWVHPTKGKSAQKHYLKRSRYLCITNPYRDPEKLEEQKKYWKSKYNIDIEKDWLVDILIMRREEHLDTKDEKVVVLRNNKTYTFPIETLEANKTQKEYKVVLEDAEQQKQS